MKSFQQKEVLITGAGSGIGRATAIAFASKGARLWLADIDEPGNKQTAQLIEKAGGVARTLHCNVADLNSVKQAAAIVHKDIEALDILMNNAGIGSGGRFLDTKPDTWKKVMDINVMGVLNGCHAFLPNMVARNQGGHVVNTASAAGFIAMPDMPIYGASKFAVVGFTEALRGDMASHGIGVSAICPGIINTPIVARSIMEGEMHNDKTQQKIQQFYKKRNYTPERVAKAVLQAVRKNIAVQPVSPEAWGMYYSKRFTPWLVRQLAKVDAPVFK